MRYIRKILVALSPDLNNLFFLTACDRIARFYNAEFTVIRVIKKDKSAEKIELIRRETELILENTQSKSEILLVKGDSPLKIITEASASYDLLITGNPIHANRFEVMLGNNKDKYAENAACSVLRLSIN